MTCHDPQNTDFPLLDLNNIFLITRKLRCTNTYTIPMVFNNMQELGSDAHIIYRKSKNFKNLVSV